MAYQVGSTCYSTAQAALQAIASSQTGAIVQHGGSAFVVDAQPSGGASITYTYKAIDNSNTFANVVSLTPQPCGLMDWQDGMQLGWAVAAIWLVTAGVMFIRRGVHL